MQGRGRHHMMVLASTLMKTQSLDHAKIIALGRWNSTKKENDMATKLHQELSQVMEQKMVIQNKQPKGFLHFLKTNSSQMLTIGATFFCVILSYQIIALRQSGRTRQAELEAAKENLLQKQILLQSLTDEEFVRQVAQECAETVGKSWWGFQRQQRSDLAARMHSIINRNLAERIGDAGLTEEQTRGRAVDALCDTVPAAIGETVEDIEIIEDATGSKIVQKRVFSI